MRKLNWVEIEYLVTLLVEYSKRRALLAMEKGDWTFQRPVISNEILGKAVPREWYDFSREQVHITKPQKALIRGMVRLGFADFGRHGGKREGAGRPKGRTVKSRTITLPNEAWEIIDRARGKASPSRLLQALIESMDPAEPLLH